VKQGYKCDFCENFFANEIDAERHENACGHNPKNKVNNELIFRLSMIYESLPEVVACALYEVAKDELDLLYAETERADENNCPYMIKQNQNRILWAIRSAQRATEKHKGRNSNTYKDVVKENPELFQAIVDTLRRKAWNEI